MKRFSKKIDLIFWFMIMILPIIIYFVMSFNVQNQIDFTTFIQPWTFSFVSDIFNDIFVDEFVFSPILISYISYCVSVEIMHVFFDFIVFLPRLAHKFIGRLYHDD